MTNANVTLSPYERAVNILNELTPRQDTIISAALDTLRAALATAQAERSEALAECNCAVLERDAALQRAEQAEHAAQFDLAQARRRHEADVVTIQRVMRERDAARQEAAAAQAHVANLQRQLDRFDKALKERDDLKRAIEMRDMLAQQDAGRIDALTAAIARLQQEREGLIALLRQIRAATVSSDNNYTAIPVSLLDILDVLLATPPTEAQETER